VKLRPYGIVQICLLSVYLFIITIISVACVILFLCSIVSAVLSSAWKDSHPMSLIMCQMGRAWTKLFWARWAAERG